MTMVMTVLMGFVAMMVLLFLAMARTRMLMMLMKLTLIFPVRRRVGW